MRKSPVTNTAQFIERARSIHGDKYNYSQVEFVNNKTHVIIGCPIHGDFSIVPHDHNNSGRGCGKCGNEVGRQKRTKTVDTFIADARRVHGDKYDYSQVVYVNAFTKVKIVDEFGRVFEQTPANHLSGHGSVFERNDLFSKKYTNKKMSEPKSEIKNQYYLDFLTGYKTFIEFLDSLCVQYNKKDTTIVIPLHNLAIEYYPLIGGKDNSKSRRAFNHNIYEELGIRLITIFEDEWLQKGEIVKSTLKHFLGLSEKGCSARQVQIKEIEHSVAKGFLTKHHLLGSGAPNRYRSGAFHGDVLVGVMTFNPPNNEQGVTDQIEMTRFVTDGFNHPGLGSRMFSWAVKAYGFERIVAFVDRRWFTGSFKMIAGFNVVEVIEPSFFWTDGVNRFHRRYLSKEKAASLLGVDDTSISKSELMGRLGYSRVWDCGHIKLEWLRSL